MSQISEIPASAYTLEKKTLGALPDIPTFDGDPVPVSRNSLTPGMRPLPLLPLPGTEFSVRYETSWIRGFQSEIPASAYTLEMEILGVIPDIPVFEGDRIPVSRNALTSGIRPRQFLRALGSDFLIGHNTDAMRGFQSEVDLSKARAGGSSTDASAFWDLLDPPMRSRVIYAGFGDYASGLRRTQP
ncbi:hypothetical protein JCGZ_13710 [Jatropha curcas]|uniref:Uncharacterized protein n=1 Tax=Jatropha curcas TaxID=180498 RepID=A0A067LNY9_JATCU|nr:hypothetical protein JCGZ_13710 [Jatropha curcas]